MTGKLKRKPKGTYHHPDLQGALVEAALQTIRKDGVDSLTLRDVGLRLGVSRTALYRHFKDKSALLARLALEGFRIFHQTLQSAVDQAHANKKEPLEEMGVAYVTFAMANQSHYKTMFSDAICTWGDYPDLALEADGAFAVLVNTIAAEQRAGRIVAEDPARLAQVIWAGVHGLATLGMAGHLGNHSDIIHLARHHCHTLFTGLRPAPRNTTRRAKSAS